MAGAGATFFERIERHGVAAALFDDAPAPLSYAELAAAADDFAAQLGPARRLVAIEGSCTRETVIAYLSALRGGHVVLMADARTLAPGSDVMCGYAPDAIYRRTGDGFALTLDEPRGGLHPDLALLLSTSGSTGAAKLVRLSARALDANALAIADYLALTPADRAATTLPLHYSYGLSVLNSHLAVGASLWLTESSVVAPEFWDGFAAHRCSSFAGVPHTYDLLMRSGYLDRRTPGLRYCTQAGGRLDPAVVARFDAHARAQGAAMVVMYGQTEATARMSYVPPEMLVAHPDCIGIAIPGGTLTLRDEAGTGIVATGVAGELIYSGPNVMMGYAMERADLARGADIAELVTGDIAEWTAGGLLRITGRKNRFVKPFGLRIGLDRIEALLAEKGIAAAVTGTDTLIAIAVWNGEDPAEIARVAAAASTLPAALFAVRAYPDAPLLASGKYDYKAILADAETGQAQQVREAEVEPLATVLAQILGRDTVGAQDSFASLGGDSLSYVAAVIAIEDRLGHLPEKWHELPIASLEAMARPAARSGAWTMVDVDAEMLTRALAIASVVGNHASALPVGGGVTALILLTGYNLARFQSAALARGAVGGVLKRLLVAVLMPYFAIIAAFSLLWKPVDPQLWTLTANWHDGLHGFTEPFWYISAYAQLIALVVLSALLWRAVGPPLTQPRRFATGCALMLIALAVMAAGLAGGWAVPGRSLDQVVPLVVIGWLASDAANSRQKAAVMGAALALLWIEHGGPQGLTLADLRPACWLLVPLALVMFRARLALPRFVRRAVILLSAASFTIYLVHTVPLWLLQQLIDDEPGLIGAAAALLFGVACHFGTGQMRALFARWGEPLRNSALKFRAPSVTEAP